MEQERRARGSRQGERDGAGCEVLVARQVQGGTQEVEKEHSLIEEEYDREEMVEEGDSVLSTIPVTLAISDEDGSGRERRYLRLRVTTDIEGGCVRDYCSSIFYIRIALAVHIEEYMI